MTIVFEGFAVFSQFKKRLFLEKAIERLDVLDRVQVQVHEEEDQTASQSLVLDDAEAFGERLVDFCMRLFGQENFETMDCFVGYFVLDVGDFLVEELLSGPCRFRWRDRSKT
jgi:hypothetical protein